MSQPQSSLARADAIDALCVAMKVADEEGEARGAIKILAVLLSLPHTQEQRDRFILAMLMVKYPLPTTRRGFVREVGATVDPSLPWPEIWAMLTPSQRAKITTTVFDEHPELRQPCL